MPAARTGTHSQDDVSSCSSLTSCSTDSVLQTTVLSRARTGRATTSPYARPGTSKTTSIRPRKVTSVVIKGQHLNVTKAFDTFYRFSHERNEIDIKRRAGEDWPWSQDTIFQKHPFCNTFRVNDRTTQWFLDNVIAKGSKKPMDVLFRVLLFTTFTRIETYEMLEEALAPLTWKRFNTNFSSYIDILDAAKDRKQALYTGSFQKPGPHWTGSTHRDHLELLQIMLADDQLLGVITEAKYLVEVYEFIASYPSFGAFSAYQALLNLTYTELLNFSDDDFVVAGCGALSGIGKIFHTKDLNKARAVVPDFDTEVIRWLAKTQHEHFARLGLGFRGLGPDKLPMQLVDIEHTLCEVDKYCRVAHPQLHGTSTKIRNTFSRPEGLERALSPTTHIPAAWAHPDRKTARIRKEGAVIVKQYLIKSIKDVRKVKGKTEYLVHWFGYGADDDTWQPEAELLEDARQTVEDFLAKSKR